MVRRIISPIPDNLAVRLPVIVDSIVITILSMEASPTHSKNVTKKSSTIVWFQAVVLLIALMASVWLLMVATRATDSTGMPGCSGVGSNCNTLLNSVYSKWFGISVSFWGLAFLVIQAVLWRQSLARSNAVSLMMVTSWAASGVVAGGWFFYVMKSVLGSYCLLCLSVHIANFVYFLLALARLEFSTDDPAGYLFNVRFLRWKGLTVALLVLQMAMIYFATAPGDLAVVAVSDVDDPIKFAQIEPSELQTIKGNPKGDRHLVIFTCLTCPACRQVHSLLVQLEQNGQLNETRVDIRFFPLSAACNSELKPIAANNDRLNNPRACELARIALSVAAADADKFSEFIDWMYENQSATIAKAREWASQQLGQQNLQDFHQSETMDLRMQRDLELAKRMNVSQVPQIFTKDGVVTGAFDLRKLKAFFE